MFLALFACIYFCTVSLCLWLPAVLTAAPMTGDINFMIIVAVILIAAFMIFVLLKGKHKDR